MSGVRAYDPDRDVKDTRRRVVAVSDNAFWETIVKRPLEYLNRSQGVADAYPQLDRDMFRREVFMNLCHAQWSRTRGVYAFDSTLAGAIDETPLDGLPQGFLWRLPEWAIYLSVEAPHEGQWLHGGYVAVIQDETGLFAVLTSVMASGVPATPYSYHTLMFAVMPDETRPFRERFELAGERLPSDHARLLTRAAYLCTAEPDIRDPREPRALPQRKRNNGPVRQWEVGYRFGAAFRQQLAEAQQRAGTGHSGERNRPRVHVRRAHWHSYWTGPKDGERKRIVKWLPPVIVNAEGDELPVTIWRQK